MTFWTIPRLKRARLELDTMDFNLHALMGDLAEMMAERVGDKRLELSARLRPKSPLICRATRGACARCS